MLLLGSAVDFSEGFLQPIGGDEQNQRQGLTLAPAVIFKVQFLYRYNQRKRARKKDAKYETFCSKPIDKRKILCYNVE